MDGYTGTDDDEGRGGNECVGNRVLDRRLTVHESICHWYVHHIQSQIKARAGINIWGFSPKRKGMYTRARVESMHVWAT